MKRRLKIAVIVVISLVLLIIAGVLIFLYGCTTGRIVNGNAGTQHAGLYVDGTVLRRADGSPVVMRGVNHAHCWYRDKDAEALKAAAQWGSNSVRIVLANGIQWESDNAASLTKVIEDVKALDMLSVLEIHDGTGSDDIGVLDKIVDSWISFAPQLQGTEDYCILNIANEWCGSWDADLWCEGYTKAILRLREAGIKNVIMVDAAGWGQYGRSIRKNGIKVFESDPDRNTMFSVHMYGMSGRFEWLIRYNLEGATDQNLCVCVGEFGYTHSDGDVKEDYLMKYCEEFGIGTLAWSFKGNSGGVEYLDLSEDWTGTKLTPEWGENVVNGEYGIRKTSKPYRRVQ